MSVATFVSGDAFIYRVVKHLITNPDNTWVNTYEFTADISGSEGALLTLGTALVNFEIGIHYETTIFDRLIISTWEPDSVPYDPLAFISTSLTGIGDQAVTSDALGLNQVLSVTRVATSGRFGHLFYRNCVAEEDVAAPAGVTRLNDRAFFQARIDAALGSSGLDAYIGVGATEALKLAMVGSTLASARVVVGLTVQGMSTVPLDHKWFNRTSP